MRRPETRTRQLRQLAEHIDNTLTVWTTKDGCRLVTASKRLPEPQNGKRFIFIGNWRSAVHIEHEDEYVIAEHVNLQMDMSDKNVMEGHAYDVRTSFLRVLSTLRTGIWMRVDAADSLAPLAEAVRFATTALSRFTTRSRSCAEQYSGRSIDYLSKTTHHVSFSQHSPVRLYQRCLESR